MFIFNVERALNEKRMFQPSFETYPSCADIETLIAFLPTLMKLVDDTLFDGSLHRFLQRKQIPFEIKSAQSGPAAMTTYDNLSGMCVVFNTNAWVTSFPAMVGGNLCTRADRCLIQTFLHEMVHVMLFCVYLELGMTQKAVESEIVSYLDSTHNVIFTTWLLLFFGQDTVDNSLLLHSHDETVPLVFEKSVRDVEQTCLQSTNQNKKRFFYQGLWQDVHIDLGNQKGVPPHHSRVMTPTDGHKFIVPNGLLSC